MFVSALFDMFGVLIVVSNILKFTCKQKVLDGEMGNVCCLNTLLV